MQNIPWLSLHMAGELVGPMDQNGIDEKAKHKALEPVGAMEDGWLMLTRLEIR